MPVTQEPRGLNWINNVNMTSFGPLVSQVCWFIGSVAFTAVACILLLRMDGPSVTAGIPTSHEAQRQLGLALAGYMLAAWTGKTIVGAVDAHSKRKAYPPLVEAEAKKVEAEAKGKAEGEATTREHAAPAPVVVTAKGAAETEVKVGEEPPLKRVSGPTLPVGVETDRRKPSVFARNTATDKPRPEPKP